MSGNYFKVSIPQIVSGLSDGIKTVTTAGTPEQLSTTSVTCEYVIISPITTNTGDVVVGGTTVIATATQRQGVTIGSTDIPFTLPVNNLNLVWLDVEYSGQGISYLKLS